MKKNEIYGQENRTALVNLDEGHDSRAQTNNNKTNKLNNMSKERSFQIGFDKAIDGASEASGFFDFSTIGEDKEERAARERGFEAGVVIRALREDDDN